jgi:hypothetical protein
MGWMGRHGQILRGGSFGSRADAECQEQSCAQYRQRSSGMRKRLQQRTSAAGGDRRVGGAAAVLPPLTDQVGSTAGWSCIGPYLQIAQHVQTDPTSGRSTLTAESRQPTTQGLPD